MKNTFSIVDNNTILVCHAGFIACAMGFYSFPFRAVQDLFLPRAGTASYSPETKKWEIIITEQID